MRKARLTAGLLRAAPPCGPETVDALAGLLHARVADRIDQALGSAIFGA